MKIRCKPTPERVPAMPRNLLRFECGPNYFSNQSVKVQRFSKRVAKNKSASRISRTNPVPVEKKLQLSDHRNGSFALFPLGLSDLVSPYGLLHVDGLTVVAVPNESTDFSLAGSR